MIDIYKWTVVELSDEKWIMLYDDDTKKILIEPQQCSGSYTCASTLVVSDSKEELQQYISDNNLILNDFLV
jgi:hypothetical protein